MIKQGTVVDVLQNRMYKAEVHVKNGKIAAIIEKDHQTPGYIIPGFIDAHVHIESAMVVPSAFAKTAVLHGTVATVSDPHEIANVLGVKGVEYMLDNAARVPFKFHFGAPSCVPATTFESAGATINATDVKSLLQRSDIYYLTEMMNYPGVIHKDQEVLDKIAWAKHYNKPIDGHAPGVLGKDLQAYVGAGISTDHECFSYTEALEKIQAGMHILIREGSAAKNFEQLIDLLALYPEKIMFCSDDKHPDDLLLGHINTLCKRAVAKGIDVFKVLRAACVNPVKHYNLQVGLLQKNDPADFVVVADLQDFKVLETYIDGVLVAKDKECFMDTPAITLVNNFKATKKQVSDFSFYTDTSYLQVIHALDGQLITNASVEKATKAQGNCIANPDTDILKLTVVNRYADQKPAIAFIKNFGLKNGAIASSVAHDCHNIIAVGTTDALLQEAVNTIITQKGGVCCVTPTKTEVLPLPIAGIMSDLPTTQVAAQYQKIDAMAKALGCKLQAPFMTLSFMALLVIPELKLSDKGLFSTKTFAFTSLEMENPLEKELHKE